ncbi:hypothetical protein I4U23_004096 [Adineta vaga]|nr:hypothetical protein I4U23_004096 [Adineta vaga]
MLFHIIRRYITIMEQPSKEKHFVCQSQTCNNRCDSQHAVHCNRVCSREHFGYGKSYKCEKCGNFPYNEYLIPVVKEFRRLHSLEISRRHNTLDADVQSQLQLLLDHTTDLYSLKFDSWSEIKQSTTSEKLTPMIIKSQSIRQLNLLGFCHCFTHEECLDFSRSSIAIHCEVLCIRVEQRKSILYLINTMDTLRALVVRSVDDSWTCFQKDENELDRWLKQNLSSECSIQRDSRSMRLIRIWIHR